MPIDCKLCGRQFTKLITSTHLKRHNIKTEEYIKIYGKKSISSEEYRKSRSIKNLGTNNPNYGNKMSDKSKKNISLKNTGKKPWNKGLKFDDTTMQKNSALKREEKYKSGELIRKVVKHTDQTKIKIARSIKIYAQNNPEELHNRALKSLETKKQKGLDLAPFRGRVHTDESKLKISKKSIEIAKLKRIESRKNILEKINQSNLTLLNDFDDYYLELQCKECKTEFTHTPQMFHPSKYNSKICRICNPRNYDYRSKGEIELYEYVKTLCADAINNYRYLIKGEIDIFIPSLNIGIEYNGLYWHSEEVLEYNGRNRTYDYEKYLKVMETGTRSIIIFEDEWQYKKEIVKSRLRHILKTIENKIYARKCIIKEIDSKISSEFCNKYHIQGNGRSNVRLGLYYNEELVSVMTFVKNNLSRRINEWELNRFCSINDYSIIGGASKLFKYFTNMNLTDKIITYADRRWSIGNLYEKLGFVFEKNSPPSYWYFYPNEGIRHHRFALRKNSKDDLTLTEAENRKLQGWQRIWDCGNSKYVWNKN